MSFKKVLITTALLIPCLLAGCEKKGGYFKEYTFNTEATDEQKGKIADAIKDNVGKVSKIIGVSNTYSDNVLRQYSSKDEVTTEILEDSSNTKLLILNQTASSISSSEEEGIKVERNIKEVKKEWDTGVGCAIVTYETTTNKTTSNRSQTYTLSLDNEKNKEQRITSLMGLENIKNYITAINSMIYINRDGSYTFIRNNEVSKTVSYIDVGKSTKEYIKESKTQEVYTISKDYKFTSYYKYTEESSNRDPSTNEWYKSVKVTSYSYKSLKFEYGKRSIASVDELTNKAVVKKDLIVSKSIKCYETVTDSNTIAGNPQDSEVEVSINYEKEIDNGYEFSFNSNLSRGYSSSTDINPAQRFEIQVSTITNNNKIKTETYRLTFDNSVIETTLDKAYEILLVGNNPRLTYLVNTSRAVNLYLTFVVELTNGNTVTVKSITIR